MEAVERYLIQPVPKLLIRKNLVTQPRVVDN